MTAKCLDRTRDGPMRGPMGTVFAPAEKFMTRMSLATKFIVLAAVLLAPLAYVTWSYRNAKEFNVRIAVKEKHGDAYMIPAIELFGLEVQARADAIRGKTVNGSGLDEAVAKVEPLVKQYGGEY